MEHLPFEITSKEYEFYGEHLLLPEGAVEEFLSCLHMIRRIPGIHILREKDCIRNPEPNDTADLSLQAIRDLIESPGKEEILCESWWPTTSRR